MVAKQTGAQIKIVVYNPDNGKTSNFYKSNTSVQHEPGDNVSRNEPINPPPTLPPSSYRSPFKSQPLAIDFHHDYATVNNAFTTICRTSTNASWTPISATPLVSHLPSKKKTTVASSKTKKNNASSVASNKIIPEKDLKDLCTDLLNQQKASELSTKKP